MNGLDVQLDTSEHHRPQTAPGGAAHVADNSPAPETAWRSRPVRWIIFCGIVLTVAIAVGTSIMLSNLRSRALSENEREIQNIALILAEQMEHDFAGVESVQINLIERLRALGIASSEDYERKMSGYDNHLMLKDRIVGLHHLGTVTLVNSQGQVFNFSRAWPIPDISVADRDFFTALQSDEKLNSVISKPIRNRATGTWAVQIARKVSGPNGKFLGLVLGAIELQSIEQFFARVSLGPDSSIALLHRDGELMVRYPHIESAIGRPIPGGLAVKLVSNSDHGIGRRIGAIGNAEDRLIAAHRVARYPLVIAATTNVAAVLADWRHTAIYLTGIAALAILVVAAGAFLVIRQFKNHAALERARAEKAEAEILREQTLRLDAALSNMSQGLAMFDRDRKLIVCNKRYAEVYNIPSELTKPGTTQREILEQRIASGSYTGPAPLQYLNDRVSVASERKRTNSILELINGQSIFVCHQPTEDGGWVSTHEDVTEKVRAKQLVEQKSLQLDTALNNMSQGLVMFDSAARLVVCNDRYRQIYDLPPDLTKPGCAVVELLKHRVANGTYSGNPEEYVDDLLATIAQGKMAKQEVETDDGRVISIVNQPMAGGGWVATHEDITEATRQEASFRLLFKNNPVPMWVYDIDSLHFLAVNEAAVAHYGYSREQFLTMTVMDIRPPEEHERFAKFVPIARGAHRGETIWRHQKSDKTKIDVAIYSRALSYEGHKASLVASIDVTERKRAEALIEESHKNLERAETMARLGHYKFGKGATAVTWSDGLYRIVGKSPETFTPTFSSVSALVHPDDRPALEQYRHDVLSGRELAPLPLRLVKDDGQIVYLENWARSIRASDGSVTGMFGTLQNVTERKRAEDELRRTQNFFNTVVENVPLPIVVKSVPSAIEETSEYRFTLINRAAEIFFGVSRDQMIGKSPHDMYPKERADFIVGRDSEALRADRPIEVHEHTVERSNDDIRIVTSRKVAIRDDDGRPEYLLSLLEDVTERKRAEQRVAHMAHHDTLTGLPSRAAFNECLSLTLDQATKTREHFAIMSIDLDRFKEINDVFGHVVGDALLLEVARRLQATAGEAFLARLGGDEFSLIVADGAQPATAAALANRLRAAVADDFEIEGLRLHMGLSIGVAVYPTDAADAKTLMSNADAALYRAKAEARGSVRFFEPEMDTRLRERLALQNDLRSAIDRGELILHYQPQMRMAGEPVGFEALVRWQCPKRGMVAPGTFIPIAEESSLIISVGEWVLREACREAASWPQPLQIAVNISPIQFRHGDLPSVVHSILLKTGLAPGRLELEITEGVMISDFSRAVSILRRLKSLGVRIAMDDFGTGYSSLSYLQSFSFDKIKIDRTFVCGLERNRHSMAIVRAIIGLGRSLDLPVMAEGVETEAQHVFLLQEGCDEVQGYLTGRPLPIADYAKLVGRQAIADQSYATAG